jgi:hypothetical protein
MKGSKMKMEVVQTFLNNFIMVGGAVVVCLVVFGSLCGLALWIEYKRSGGKPSVAIYMLLGLLFQIVAVAVLMTAFPGKF